MKRNIKELLLSNKKFMKCYCLMEDIPFELVTLISPKLDTSLRFRQANGYFPNYKNPKTFTEKLVWLKLNRYMNNPLVIQCADKYRVREYVEKCGCGDILNELIGVYDSVDAISWELLPNKFAMKWNFGAGMNLICADKETLNIQVAKKKLRAWGKKNIGLVTLKCNTNIRPKKLFVKSILKLPMMK